MNVCRPLLLAVTLSLFSSATPAQWAAIEIQELDAGATSTDDFFGFSVDVDGDRAVVGAPSEDGLAPDSGRAHVFTRSGGVWSPEAVLEAFDGQPLDFFGVSVSIDGDTALVGAFLDEATLFREGSVYVFVRSGTTWAQQTVLNASDPTSGMNFGGRVVIQGDTAVIGAPGKIIGTESFAGGAYVFVRTGGVWSEEAILEPGDPTSLGGYGSGLAFEGDTLLVGAPLARHLTQQVGAVYAYQRQGTAWSEVQKIVTSGLIPVTRFGDSVALEGELAVVGAPFDSTTFWRAGSAYVFRKLAGTWIEETKLAASDAQEEGDFGSEVALSGDVAVICSPGTDFNGLCSVGAAYVFVDSLSGWTEELKIEAPHPETGLFFANSVALVGSRAVLGTSDSYPAGGHGRANVYSLGEDPSTSYCTAGTSASTCRATLSSSGVPSASAPFGYYLLTSDVEGAKDGLFYFGSNGRQANPWGNGTSFQCVVPPVSRAGLLVGTGTADICDGTFVQDLNALWCPTCPKPQKNPGAGATLQSQLWYRDPQSTSNQTTSLSDAVENVLGP